MRNRSIKATLILAALFGLGCSSQPVSIQPTDSRSPYFSALSRSPAILAAAPIGTTLDANGNTIQDVSSTYNVAYEYDVNGRLIHQTVQVVSTSVSYETRSVYDADGNKIGFYDLDKTYTYVNSQVRTVERPGSAPKALLAYEDCETTETGTLNCFAKDHLGSVVGVFEVTSAGASAWKQVKDTLPFGQDLIHYETADFANGVDYGFNGNRKEGIAALNQDLIDYAARHLKTVTGRFLQADTVTPAAGQSILNFNRYAYARNNPVNRIDPDGHDDLPTHEQIYRPTIGSSRADGTVPNELSKIATVDPDLHSWLANFRFDHIDSPAKMIALSLSLIASGYETVGTLVPPYGRYLNAPADLNKAYSKQPYYLKKIRANQREFESRLSSIRNESGSDLVKLKDTYMLVTNWIKPTYNFDIEDVGAAIGTRKGVCRHFAETFSYAVEQVGLSRSVRVDLVRGFDSGPDGGGHEWNRITYRDSYTHESTTFDVDVTNFHKKFSIDPK